MVTIKSFLYIERTKFVGLFVRYTFSSSDSQCDRTFYKTSPDLEESRERTSVTSRAWEEATMNEILLKS